jgi:2-oxoglutarate dehydrogenase complex dihydrolipoamide succinyltransferase (E2) component
MEYKVIVPPLGESVVEGTIVKWIKNEGDSVKADDALVEIMTDKINVEIPSPYDGVMKKHLAAVDTIVEIGDEIAVMDVEGEATTAKTFQTSAQDNREHIPSEQDVTEPPVEFVGASEHHCRMGIQNDEEAIEAGIKAVKSSPVVRRLAREHFIDLRKIQGTGKNGRVSKQDVIKYIDMRHQVDKVQPDFVFPNAEPEEIIPVTGIRKVISEHMVDSAFSIPHVTTFDECDMSALVKWRKRHVDTIEEKHGVRITYMPFIAKAIIFATRDFPWMNSTLEDNSLHVKKYFNIGLAVARDNSLIVPVVKHCEQKSLLQIGREMKEMADKANADNLKLDDISGGTFSITNAGGMGALASTPIIAKPQVAILGVHKIVEKPVVREGEIVIRPMLNFGLSFDHRVIDGGYAVQFLRRLIEYLEDPDSWLIDVI